MIIVEKQFYSFLYHQYINRPFNSTQVSETKYDQMFAQESLCNADFPSALKNIFKERLFHQISYASNLVSIHRVAIRNGQTWCGCEESCSAEAKRSPDSAAVC